MCTGGGGREGERCSGKKEIKKERKKKETEAHARYAAKCKESEFPFSRRSTEGIGPRAGSSYDRISHWRTRRVSAVDTGCHLSRLTTTGRSRSISDIPPGISNPLCSRLFFVDVDRRRRRLFRASSVNDSIELRVTIPRKIPS